MSKYQHGQFQMEHLTSLKKGISLYNQGYYWECHEELEDVWMDYIGDNARYVCWAIIQVAISLYHHEDSNLNGASGMINKAKRKVEFIEKNHVESNLLDEYLDWTNFKLIIKSISHHPRLCDFNNIKLFKFKNPNFWKLEI